MPISRRYRRLVDKQEKKTAKDLSGKVQPGSGNIKHPFLKEDALGKEVLAQCKMTEKPSFRITRKEFDLTTERALSMCRMPCWRVDMQGTDVAIIRWDDYVQILRDAGLC